MGEIVITEADLVAAAKKFSSLNLKGDSVMIETEWEVRPPTPKPPPLVGIQTPGGILRGTLAYNGTVCVWNTRTDDDVVRGVNLRWLIASLQRILVLAEKHFGEDWGK